MAKESHLLEELERLSVSGLRGTGPPTPRSFTPLLDVPVDRYESRYELGPRSAGPALPNWLLAHSSDSRPPARTDIGTVRSVHFDEASLRPSSDAAPGERGRSPFRNDRSKGKKERSGDRSRDATFTLQSAARRTRPLLSQVFDQQVNGHRASPDDGLKGPDPEHELRTVSISKTKQSLGK